MIPFTTARSTPPTPVPTAVARVGLSPATALPLESFTPREREILRLLAAGYSTKEIASRLRVRLATIKTHIHNLYGKLGARTHREALRAAHRRGDLLS